MHELEYPSSTTALSFNRFEQFYFEPKPFELFKGRSIYEWMGIRTYKKFLPTTGDLARKQKKIRQIQVSRTDRITELRNYEKQTRKYEWRHLLGMLLFILLAVFIDKKWTLFDWCFLTGLNLYVNVYPIFLQRYNRTRIIELLRKLGEENPIL